MNRVSVNIDKDLKRYLRILKYEAGWIEKDYIQGLPCIDNQETNRIMISNGSIDCVIDRRKRVYKYIDGEKIKCVGVVDPYTSTKRGAIEDFSRRSRIRMIERVVGSGVEIRSFITLTFHKNELNGEKAKKALKTFLGKCRYEVKNNEENKWNFVSVDVLGSYLWFMEFQKRGSIHFHIFAEKAVKGEIIRDLWLSSAGMEGDNEARKYSCKVKIKDKANDEEMRGICLAYALKYGLKGVQKLVPENAKNVGRFWAVRNWDFQKVKILDRANIVRIVKNYLRKKRKNYKGGIFFLTGDHKKGVVNVLNRLMAECLFQVSEALEELGRGSNIRKGVQYETYNV